MGFFLGGPRTAEQKAKSAKSRILFRAAALAFIVFYVIIPMINLEPEAAEEINPALRYLAIVGFSLGAIGVGIVSAREYIKSKKAGLFEASAYTDDEGIAVATDNTENSSDDNDVSVADDEDYDDDEDYEEDEDYGDDEDYDADDEDDEDYDEENK